MSLDLRTYSEQRIGSVWSNEDHAFLTAALTRIDQTCLEVWEQIRKESKFRPLRLSELIALEPPPSREDKYTLDLPFGEDSAPDRES